MDTKPLFCAYWVADTMGSTQGAKTWSLTLISHNLDKHRKQVLLVVSETEQ